MDGHQQSVRPSWSTTAEKIICHSIPCLPDFRVRVWRRVVLCRILSSQYSLFSQRRMAKRWCEEMRSWSRSQRQLLSGPFENHCWLGQSSNYSIYHIKPIINLHRPVLCKRLDYMIAPQRILWTQFIKWDDLPSHRRIIPDDWLSPWRQSLVVLLPHPLWYRVGNNLHNTSCANNIIANKS